MMEDLADYKLEFIEHDETRLDFVKHGEPLCLYELVARPIIMDRVRQLQLEDQTAKTIRDRLISREDIPDWTFDADQYLWFGGRLYVP